MYGEGKEHAWPQYSGINFSIEDYLTITEFGCWKRLDLGHRCVLEYLNLKNKIQKYFKRKLRQLI